MNMQQVQKWMKISLAIAWDAEPNLCVHITTYDEEEPHPHVIDVVDYTLELGGFVDSVALTPNFEKCEFSLFTHIVISKESEFSLLIHTVIN